MPLNQSIVSQPVEERGSDLNVQAGMYSIAGSCDLGIVHICLVNLPDVWE